MTLFLCRVSNVFHRRHLSATADRLGACMSPSAEGDANSKHPQTAVLHSRRWHNAAIKTGTLLAGGFLQNSLMSGLPAAVHTHVWSVGLPLNHCSLIHTAAVLSYCKKTEVIDMCTYCILRGHIKGTTSAVFVIQHQKVVSLMFAIPFMTL